jgi:hypothetical protein
MVHTLAHFFKNGKTADEKAAQEISDNLDAFDELKTVNEILDFCKKHLSFCREYKDHVLRQTNKFKRSSFVAVSKIPYAEDIPTLIGQSAGRRRMKLSDLTPRQIKSLGLTPRRRKLRLRKTPKKSSKKRKSVKKVTKKRRHY